MRRGLLCVALASGLLAACTSGGTGSGSASCAAALTYDGRVYVGHAAAVVADDLGRALGGARIPPCHDTTDASGAGEETGAVEIKGVSPDVAGAAAYSNGVIFVREDYPFASLPEAARRLLSQ